MVLCPTLGCCRKLPGSIFSPVRASRIWFRRSFGELQADSLLASFPERVGQTLPSLTPGQPPFSSSPGTVFYLLSSYLTYLRPPPSPTPTLLLTSSSLFSLGSFLLDIFSPGDASSWRRSSSSKTSDKGGEFTYRGPNVSQNSASPCLGILPKSHGKTTVQKPWARQFSLNLKLLETSFRVQLVRALGSSAAPQHALRDVLQENPLLPLK